MSSCILYLQSLSFYVLMSIISLRSGKVNIFGPNAVSLNTLRQEQIYIPMLPLIDVVPLTSKRVLLYKPKRIIVS